MIDLCPSFLMNSSYFKRSHTAFYSLVASIPLLVLYEILLALTSSGPWRIRNAVDVWFRQVLFFFDITSQQASLFMILITIFAIPVVRKKGEHLHPPDFLLMLFEALCYSLFLGTLIQWILHPLYFSTSVLVTSSFLQKVSLSLGAGLFEEFFFRVILLNALFFLLIRVVKREALSGILAILLASFLFSLSHYIGSLADAFELYSFSYRWIAGLIFTILYFLRGFAITAYTHALYDIFVLV